MAGMMNQRWFEKHLKRIKGDAGPRYLPELNISLPVSELFDSVGKTDKFYQKISNSFRDIRNEFDAVISSCREVDIQKYDQIKREMDVFFEISKKMSNYDSQALPWDKVREKTISLKKSLFSFVELIRTRCSDESKKETNHQDSCAHRDNISSFEKIIRLMGEFSVLSSSDYSKLSNNPFLLLKGDAGSGKTHLLCDLVESKIKNEEKPSAVLMFGESFSNKANFWEQVLKQLKFENGIKTKQDLLEELNNYGETVKCRFLFIIDALNENVFHAQSFWKNNLDEVIKEFKKYPNIALILSVRSGFENDILTEEQKKYFIEVEHPGFQFKEWEAVKKIFGHFSIPLPKIPLLMPEFRIPLFLILFCRAFGRKDINGKEKNAKALARRKDFRGHVGSTHIFESFVKKSTKTMAKEFNLKKEKNDKGEYLIWNTVIKKIAEKMTDQQSDRVSEQTLKKIIREAHPEVDVSKFALSLERNMLIQKYPSYEKEQSFYIRFPFQKFSNHLIGRYIFKKYEKEVCKENKNVDTARKFFSKEGKFGDLLSKPASRGIIEALSIQCPEQLKGVEFIEVVPYLLKEPLFEKAMKESFLESVIWRKPDRNMKNAIKIIDSSFREDDDYRDLMNTFLSIATVPNHPLNAEYLFNELLKLPMPKRDAKWSTFLHYEYGEKTSVDRILDWSYSEQEKKHLTDKSVRLTSIALSWFLTTSNRFVRDKATKGLILLLKDRIKLLPALLEKFEVKEVDDRYITERLYAVAYGCVLINQEDKKNLETLARWVYDKNFKNNKPRTHILLRDYARGIVETALRRKIKLEIEEDNILPPYESEWPKQIPSKQELEKLVKSSEDSENKSLSDIWTSVEHSDFALYVIGTHSGMSEWKEKDEKKLMIKEENLPLYTQRWIFDRVVNLGYDSKLHGIFDESIRMSSTGDHISSHKPERILKKYQWIAYHEFMALVSDHFELSWPQRSYKGPWDLHLRRDIDPSFILTNDSKIKSELDFSEWISRYGPSNSSWKKPDLEWIKAEDDLPDIKKLIQLVDFKKREWLALCGDVTWREQPFENENHATPSKLIKCSFQSYILEKKSIGTFLKWAENQNFMEFEMPKPLESYEFFLGEYPASLAVEDLRGDYKTWIDDLEQGRKLPSPVCVSSESYLNEFTLDCSNDGSASVSLPCKLLVEGMKLHQKFDGMFYDEKNKLITISTGIFESNFSSALIIDKKSLIDFLDKNSYTIVWIGWVRKILPTPHSVTYPKCLDLSGYFTIKNGDIEGRIH